MPSLGFRPVALLFVLASLLQLDSPGCAASLSFLEVHRDDENGVDGLAGAIDVLFTPEGEHVYVAGYWDGGVAHFIRQPGGSLSFQEVLLDGIGLDLYGVSSLAHMAGPDVLLAAAAEDDALVRLARDPETGSLVQQGSFVDGVSGVDHLDGAVDVVVTPDGSLAFVSAYWDEAVSVFAGGLIYHSAVVDGVDGVDGLAGASGLAVSPDGQHLYVAGSLEDRIAIFEVGTPLTYVGTVGEPSDVLRSPNAIEIDAEGARVYVTCRYTGAVVVYERDSETGLLAFLESHLDDVGAVEGLAGATGLQLSPDQRWLAAAGIDDDGLAVFSRDLDTGRLEFAGFRKSPSSLDGAAAVVWSPDGSTLVVPGVFGSSLAVLREPALFQDGFESGNVESWTDSTP